MIHELMHVTLHRPVAAGRVRVEPTARAHGDLSRLLHRLDREIAGRLEDDSPLAGRVPVGCGEFHRSPREPSEGCLAAGRQASPRVFSPSFTPPCPFLDTPIPLLCTPIFVANR